MQWPLFSDLLLLTSDMKVAEDNQTPVPLLLLFCIGSTPYTESRADSSKHGHDSQSWSCWINQGTQIFKESGHEFPDSFDTGLTTH